MSKIFAISAVTSCALLLGGTAAYATLSGGGAGVVADCGLGAVGGDIGGPFALSDGQGKRVTSAEVITKPTLVYFGYTFCPDACPMDMSRNAEVVDKLFEKGHDVGLVFISLDPARDTVEVVGEYAAAYSDRAVGLTGSAEEVAAAARAYRVYYKAQETGDAYYTLDHSTFTYLMQSETGFTGFFRREEGVDAMVEGVSCLLGADA